MILYYGLVLFLYPLFRFVLPLPAPRWVKWLAGLSLLIIAQKLMWLRLFFGSIVLANVPGPALFLMGWLFMGLFFLVVLLLLRDITSLVLFMARKAGLHTRPLPNTPRMATATVGLAMLLSTYAMWEGIRVPDVRTMEITLPTLPPSLDGLTLVQLSDLHASAMLRAPRVEAVVEIVNALHPDLILLTGDLVDGTPEQRLGDMAALTRLQATHGIFAVFGNHEYYSGYSPWRKGYEALGLPVLENSHKLVPLPGGPVAIAGVSDPAASRYGLITPNPQQAMQGITPGTFTIMLDHRPAGALENAPAGAHLQLSGHTHGGIITGLDSIIAMFNQGFVSGQYQVGDMLLYVNNGVGLWSGFPGRFGVPAEITHITLRSSQNKQALNQ
ncbi:metallophosphoesterase [Desulfovibrio cuneatus]|uniref:metallophosphoesterase n=1 Tax=Desulfovibrio cuneatus TaxID=159728 RepID=UPI0003F99219|nr:metallophosphoesterase [Desulfovibrio cuneatus]